MNTPIKINEAEEIIKVLKGLNIDESKALTIARVSFQEGKSFLDDFLKVKK